MATSHLNSFGIQGYGCNPPLGCPNCFSASWRRSLRPRGPCEYTTTCLVAPPPESVGQNSLKTVVSSELQDSPFWVPAWGMLLFLALLIFVVVWFFRRGPPVCAPGVLGSLARFPAATTWRCTLGLLTIGFTSLLCREFWLPLQNPTEQEPRVSATTSCRAGAKEKGQKESRSHQAVKPSCMEGTEGGDRR